MYRPDVHIPFCVHNDTTCSRRFVEKVEELCSVDGTKQRNQVIAAHFAQLMQTLHLHQSDPEVIMNLLSFVSRIARKYSITFLRRHEAKIRRRDSGQLLEDVHCGQILARLHVLLLFMISTTTNPFEVFYGTAVDL